MKVESYVFESNIKLDLNFKPTLAFLFYEGERLDILDECYRELKTINPKIEVIGVNGFNGNINNNIPFITKEEQISLLLFELDYNSFFIKEYVLNNDFKDVKKLFVNDYKKYTNPASIIFFPFEYDANKFLDFVQDKTNMHNIYGGVYYNYNTNGVFYNGNISNNKLISVFFNQDIIQFFSIAVHGWKPVGLDFKITKSKKNIIYEIDHMPALKVIEDYIGEIKSENIEKFLHPFCVSSKGYSSLASIKSIDRKNNTIELYKYIYPNESIRVTIPSNQKQMIKIIEGLLKNISCDGLFMFSCVGRYAYYKDLLEFEIEKVADYLNVPFAGFLTYGEIGSNSINKKSILQNQTMNLIFFKGK